MIPLQIAVQMTVERGRGLERLATMILRHVQPVRVVQMMEVVLSLRREIVAGLIREMELRVVMWIVLILELVVVGRFVILKRQLIVQGVEGFTTATEQTVRGEDVLADLQERVAALPVLYVQVAA